MNDSFEKKLVTAIGAGWRVLLIAFGVLLLQWIAYLIFTSNKPESFSWLWGNGIEWSQIQAIWLYAMVAFKLFCFFLALLVAWLALWLRQWRKLSS
jgi:hypothetical protein